MHSELLKVVAKGKKGTQRGRSRVWLCGCHQYWGQAGSCLPASSGESSSLPDVTGRILPTPKETAAHVLASRSDSPQPRSLQQHTFTSSRFRGVHLLGMWEDGGSDATYVAVLVNSLKVCIHFFFFNHLSSVLIFET